MGKNKGFTLVELIVAMAITAIAGVAIFGFYSYSSKNYARTNRDVSLQYEQQLVVNQIRDLLTEANNSVTYDTVQKQMIIYNEEITKDPATGTETITYPVAVIKYDSEGQKLYIRQKVFSAVSGVGGINIADIPEDAFPAENITDFSVDLSKIRKQKVTFSMSFYVNGVEKEVVLEVALRNMIEKNDDPEEIYTETKKKADSFIDGISIQRGSTVFSSGATDSIGKNGTAASARYKAVVTTTSEYSTREYGVVWSILPKGGSDTTGISVSNGLVTISSTVANNTESILRATSTDDDSKYAEITIKVIDNYAYPETLTLAQTPNGGTTGNGYKQYVIVPTITYMAITPARADSHDYNDCIWSVTPELPEKCTFNTETGILYLNDNASNMSFTIIAMTKEDGIAGSPLVATMIINPGEIKPYSAEQTMVLNCQDTLSRNGKIHARITWDNAIYSTQYYQYDWKVEKIDDTDSIWSNSETNKFNGNIGLSKDNNPSFYTYTMTTDGATPVVMIACNKKLDWNKTFKVKLSVTATQRDQSGKKILDSVSMTKIITVNPVETVVEDTVSTYTDGNVYSTDKNINYSANNNTQNTRVVKISFKNMVANDNSMGVAYGTMNAKCKFYDNSGNEIPENQTNYSGKMQIEQDSNTSYYARMKFSLNSWSQWNKMVPKLTKMNLGVTVSDYSGNSVSTAEDKGLDFTISY